MYMQSYKNRIFVDKDVLEYTFWNIWLSESTVLAGLGNTWYVTLYLLPILEIILIYVK